MNLNIEELYKWVEQQKISRPKRHISRDFSDALPLAEILKVYYPKLVELHNYAPKNSVAEKMINWETLNRKVLMKIKMPLTQTTIRKLAKSEPGAIEKILQEIKTKVEGINGDAPHAEEAVKHKAVEELEKEIEEKNDAIRVLNNKLEHLEGTLSQKDKEINDLTDKIKTMTDQSKSFFGKIF